MGKIVIYHAQAVSKLYTIQSLLRDVVLKNTGLNMEIAHQDNLAATLTPDTLLFILPGASASSVYRDQISGRKLEQLQRRTADGMQLLGICAGGYALAHNFEYCFYDEQSGALQEKRQVQSSLGLAPVYAYGPNLQLHHRRPYDPTARWSSYDAVETAFRGRDGELINVALALANGPSFNQLDETLCQPLAHYRKTGEVAMVGFRYGQGGGILSGPAPEVGGRNLMQYIAPKQQRDPHMYATISSLESSHAAWVRLWSDLLTRLLPSRPDLHPLMARNLAQHVRECPPPARKPLPLTY
jgi:glutamine amidotransferase-like uncharacterized protein